MSSLSSEHDPELELDSEDSDDSELNGSGFFFFSFFLLFFVSIFFPAVFPVIFSAFLPVFSFFRSSVACFLSFLLLLLRLNSRGMNVMHGGGREKILTS